MDSLVEKIIIHTHMYQLYTIATSNLEVYSRQLKDKPFDIQLQGAINKVTNDIEILEAPVKQSAVELNIAIEEKYGNGKKFKFIPTSVDMIQ